MKIAVVGCGNIGAKRVKSIKEYNKTEIKYIVGKKKVKKKKLITWDLELLKKLKLNI